MLTNLLIIQIIFPLVGALVCFLLPKRFSWVFSTVIMLFTFVISLLLFKMSLGLDAIFYNLGNWSSSVGIEYKLDKLNSFFIMLVSFSNLVNILAMRNLVSFEIKEDKLPLFFGLFLLAMTGLIGVSISNDIFNIYVLLEVNAISSYALVASSKSSLSKRAAFDYLIFGTIGSTFILFGIGFVYALAGSLNLTEISYRVPELLENKALFAGMILMFIGILMKATLFPFSNWLVNIYQASPSFISAMLSSTSNKVGIYLIIRLFFDVFKLNNDQFEYLEIILLMLSIIAIFSCAILALKQTNVKKFLAYSSLSQIGFIILSIALASETAISGALIYSLTHSLEKICLFLAVGYCVMHYTSSEEVSSFGGLARINPWISILIIINLLSSVGMPLTAGFVGKWQIFKAALASDIWYILIVSIAVLFTFSYVFKFVEVLLLQKSLSEEKGVLKKDSCLIVVTLLTILNLYVGINHQFLLDMAKNVSQMVLMK